MRILLVGHGRMGRLVGDLAPEYGLEIAGILDPLSPLHGGGAEDARWRGVDVAIDFTFPDAVKTNAPALARQGINLVIGTTGWKADEPAVRQAVDDAGVGVVANSVGCVFEAIVARGGLSRPEGSAFRTKPITPPSMRPQAPPCSRTMVQAVFRSIDVSSTRAGYIPGRIPSASTARSRRLS